MFDNMVFHRCHTFLWQEHFLHIQVFHIYISNMPLGNIYKTLTKSQVEIHSILGRQQGQVKGSGQEVGETCLPVATP